MRNHLDVRNNDKERLEEDLGTKDNISISLKTNLSVFFSTLSQCATVFRGELLFETWNWAIPGRRKADPFFSIPDESENTRVWEKREWNIVFVSSYRVGSDRMGSSNTVRGKEGLLTALLRRLSKDNFCHEERGIPNIAHGRKYQLSLQSRSLLYAGCKKEVLESRNQKQRLRKDSF